jgi:uncharacterized protein
LRRRAEAGDADAQFELAVAYDHGEKVPKDEREAARLYRLSADQGNASAQCNLAQCYVSGLGGLPKDTHKAIALFRKAAEQGSFFANWRLKDLDADAK